MATNWTASTTITDTAMNAATADRDARSMKFLLTFFSVGASTGGSRSVVCAVVVVVVVEVVAVVVVAAAVGVDFVVVAAFVPGDPPAAFADGTVVSPVEVALAMPEELDSDGVAVVIVSAGDDSVVVAVVVGVVVVVVVVAVVVVVVSAVVVGGVVIGWTSGGSTCIVIVIRVEHGLSPASVAKMSTRNVSTVRSVTREDILPELVPISKLSRTTLSVLTPKLKLTFPFSLKSSSVAFTTTTVVLTAVDALTTWTLSEAGPWNTGQ